MSWENGCGYREGMQRFGRAFPAHHERHEGKVEWARSLLPHRQTNQHLTLELYSRCEDYCVLMHRRDWPFWVSWISRLYDCECHQTSTSLCRTPILSRNLYTLPWEPNALFSRSPSTPLTVILPLLCGCQLNWAIMSFPSNLLVVVDHHQLSFSHSGNMY